MSLEKLFQQELKKGEFTGIPLVEVIGHAYAKRATGELSMEKGKVKRNIFFYKGLPVYARSNAPADVIPELMVKMGRLEREDISRVKGLMSAENLSEEGALLNLGVIDSSQYYYLCVALVREIIISSCGWKEGNFLFSKEESFLNDVPLYDINPMEIIYEAITRYHEMGLAERLQNLESRTIILDRDIREFLPLPEDFYIYTDVLDQFSVGKTVGEAIAGIYREFNDIAKSLRFLYILIVTGTLVFNEPESVESEKVETDMDAEPEISEYDPDVDSTAYVVVKSPRAKRKKIQKAGEKIDTGAADREESVEEITSGPEPEPEKGDYKGPEKIESAETTVPAPASKKPAGIQTDENFTRRVDLLQQKFNNAKNFYEMLGVEIEADLAGLQKAYSRICGHYKLDAASDDESLMKRLAGLKNQLNEAVQTLTNPDTRMEYENKLFIEERKKAWNIPMKKEAAENEFKRGKWYLDNNRPELALPRFEHAMELVPEVPDYFAYVGWAMYRARKGTTEEVAGYLKNAIEADSDFDLAYYFLGVIAKRNGDEERAEKLFRKAVEINSDNTRAARELAFIEKHKNQKGFFSQLFSK